MAPPRITIITPVFNRADTISEALASVAAQGYSHIEHLVIDGGSTDGTVDVLRNTAGITWFSEPDRGPFDALNKGIRMATGDIIGHLDADDILLPGALAAVASVFTRDRSVEAACGGAAVVRITPGSDGPAKLVTRYRSERVKRLSWYDVTTGEPIHNARFFRRSWFRRAGFYDTRYRLAADRDFLVRSLMLGLRTAPLERMVYEYHRFQGPNTNHLNVRRSQKLHEEHLMIARHYMTSSMSPDPLRRAAQRWYAVESFRRVVGKIRAKSWGEARRLAAEAGQELPSWPFWLLTEKVCGLAGGCG